MAEQFTGDFHGVGTRDGGQAVTQEYSVESGAAASISAGDLVIVGNAGYVATAADGASSDDVWVGMALTDSTDTAAADGVVQVMYAPDGLVVRGIPTTPGNLAATILNTFVTLDVAAGVQTVDENDTTKGVLNVVRYDTTNGTIDVSVPFQL
jgi:hypothetical protein